MRRLIGLAAGVLMITACGGDPATLTQVEAEVLKPSCVFQACHMGGMQAAGGLDLEGSAYEVLVNAPAVEAPDRVRVTPGDVGASYLMNKLEGRDIVMGGTDMPPGQPLSEDRLELVRSWIEAGAADD